MRFNDFSQYGQTVFNEACPLLILQGQRKSSTILTTSIQSNRLKMFCDYLYGLYNHVHVCIVIVTYDTDNNSDMKFPLIVVMCNVNIYQHLYVLKSSWANKFMLIQPILFLRFFLFKEDTSTERAFRILQAQLFITLLFQIGNNTTKLKWICFAQQLQNT